MLVQFRKADSGVKGQITPEESVSQMLTVINALDASMSGTVIRAREFKA